LPTSSFLYRKVVPLLSGHMRVLVPDMPGFGRSDKDLPQSITKLRHLSYWLESFVESMLDLDRPIVWVVHDIGGLLGLHWLIDHAQIPSAMVLLNTTVFIETIRPPLAAAIGQVPRLGAHLISKGLNEHTFKWTLTRAVNTPLDAVTLEAYWSPYRDEKARDTLGSVFAGYARSMAFITGVRRRLSQIRTPTTVLFGIHDRYYPPANARKLAHALPNARLRLLPGVGHFVPEEAPDDIAQAVIELQTRITGREWH